MNCIRLFQNFEELLVFCEENYGKSVLFSRGSETVTYQEFSHNVRHLTNLFEPRKVYVLDIYDPILYAQAYYSCVLAGGIAHLSYSSNILKDANDKYEIIRDNDINTHSNHHISHTTFADSGVVCTVAFSSGTTGIMKGVMLSQKNLLTVTAYSIDKYSYWQGERLLNILPYQHLFGLVGNLLAPLHSGSLVHFPSHPLKAIHEVFTYKPDVINLPPAFINTLIRIPEFSKLGPINGGSLCKVLCGGAAFDIKTSIEVMKLGIIPCTAYGMTECSSCACVTTDDKIYLGTVGREIECVNIDFSYQGEIKICGETVMLGYYNNKEATDCVIRDGWLYTGDLGYRDNNGEICVIGRKDNLIVLQNGKKCSPEMVERIINTLNGVRDCVIIQSKDVFGKVNVNIVKESNEKIDMTGIQSILIQNGIECYSIIIREKDFIRNNLGKVIRKDVFR